MQHWERNLKLKNSHYTSAIMPKRVTRGGAHLCNWTTQHQKIVAAVASYWRRSVGFDRPGNRTADRDMSLTTVPTDQYEFTLC